MIEFALEPNTPLDIDVAFVDVTMTEDGEQQLRIKGKVGGESGRLFLEALRALRDGELLVKDPVIPESFVPGGFVPVQLRSRYLRITRQVGAVQGDGAGEAGPEMLSIAQRDVKPVSDATTYLQSTDFIIEKVLPRWQRAGVPIGDQGAAAMVHTVFIQRCRRRAGREF